MKKGFFRNQNTIFKNLKTDPNSVYFQKKNRQ